MKQILIVLSALAVVLVAAGCGDDDDSPSSPAAVPAGFVRGTIYLSPMTHLDTRIFGYGSVAPAIDSVYVGDSLLILFDDFGPSSMTPDIRYWPIQWFEDSGPYPLYNPGDVAHLEFWGNGGRATCDVVILDPGMAEAEITSPGWGLDTLEAGEAATIYWNEVQYVQFYALQLTFADFANGTITPSIIYAWTADTSYTVRPEMYPDSLASFTVEVVPFTGPHPTSAGNFTGGWLTGKITSFGAPDMTVIYGWNIPEPMKSMSPDGALNALQRSPTEIIDEVYRQAAQ